MADIIKFQEYVGSNEEEKKRIKKVSVLSSKSKNIEDLLYCIKNSVSCSFVTRHFGERNQIVGKENIIDSDILDVIINSLDDYYNDICGQIRELNSYGAGTITICWKPHFKGRLEEKRYETAHYL